MLTVGDRIPSFDLQAVVSIEQDKAFTSITDKSDAGQVEDHLLLAEGLYLRMPDRDRGLRQAERRLQRPRRSDLRRLDRQRVRPPRVAPLASGPAVTCRSRCSRTSSASCRTAFGVLDKKEGVALRATFIVDPEGIIRFVSVNDLNVGRNPRRSAASARRAADRRAVPVQLAEGRRVPEGGITDVVAPQPGPPALRRGGRGWSACGRRASRHYRSAAISRVLPHCGRERQMSIQTLKDRLPDYAKDLKLNLGPLAYETMLTDARKPARSSPPRIASRNPRGDRGGDRRSSRRRWTPPAYKAAKAAAAIMGMNNVYYRFLHLVGGRGVRQAAGEAAHERDRQPGRTEGRLRAVVAGRVSGEWLRQVHHRAREGAARSRCQPRADPGGGAHRGSGACGGRDARRRSGAGRGSDPGSGGVTAFGPAGQSRRCKQPARERCANSNPGKVPVRSSEGRRHPRVTPQKGKSFLNASTPSFTGSTGFEPALSCSDVPGGGAVSRAAPRPPVMSPMPRNVMPSDLTRTLAVQIGSQFAFGSAGRGGWARLSSSPYAIMRTIVPSAPSKMPFGIAQLRALGGRITFSPISLRTKSFGR